MSSSRSARGTSPANGPRTPAQNRRIWSLVGELAHATGLGEDTVKSDILRPTVREHSGRDSTTQLTGRQADAVIAALERHLAPYRKTEPKPAPETPENTTISPKMQAFIVGLFDRAALSQVEKKNLLERHCAPHRWPQTKLQADKVAEELKARILRKIQPRDAMARVRALKGRSELDAFLKGWVADMCRQYEEAEARGRIDRVLTTGKLEKLLEAEAQCGIRP